MKTSPKIATKVFSFMIRHVAMVRLPDFVIGADSPEGPYLLRWYLTPWRKLQGRLRERAAARPHLANRIAARVVGWLPNVYLHRFMRDDDDRALHDHPSFGISYLLAGGYIEHTVADGGIHRRRAHGVGALRFMGLRYAHRIELHSLPLAGVTSAALALFFNAPHAQRRTDGTMDFHKVHCWTLFVFGPTLREWGFHCPERGWVRWQEFTAAGKPGEVGRGCE